MKYYFAPLEGITGYLYRNAYHDFFDCGIDKYFTPFIAVNQNGLTKRRELEDLNPENNKGVRTVPQLLGNKGTEVNLYLHRLHEMGYGEVNLNLGCPYQTVVSRKKGAGLLADKDYLKIFLDDVFENVPVEVSIKTRIGMEKPEEFGELSEILTGEKMEKEKLKAFHDRIYRDYKQVMPGDKNILFKMKELWNYMQFMFENGEKYVKKIYRAKTIADYESQVNVLFSVGSLKTDGGFGKTVPKKFS